MTKQNFKMLQEVEDIKTIIKDTFELELDVQGGWGYDNNTALKVNSLNSMNLEQFVHTFATIRAILEMNLTCNKDEKYAGINATFEESKKFEINNKTYDVLSFKITAMNEKLYGENCVLICSPSGGISGLGDGNCPTFYEDAEFVRNIWVNNP